MTTCLGKSCSFGLLRVPFVNCFGFEGMMWDLIVLVPDHCLSFYFNKISVCLSVCLSVLSLMNCCQFMYFVISLLVLRARYGI